MVPFLNDGWEDADDAFAILDDASIALVRERIRDLGRELGLAEPTAARLVTAASELAYNQLTHARQGEVLVRAILRAGVPGIEVIAVDRGDGLLEPTDALRGAPRVPSGVAGVRESLGIGLAAVLELADEVDFDVRLDEGTCIWARVFADCPAHRRQVGIYGRAYPGEIISGDHAAFVRSDDTLVVGVVDGLGHGKAAREASDRAIATLRPDSGSPPDDILLRCHAELAATRGAVMGVARMANDGASRIACAGNVVARVYGPVPTVRVTGPSSFLGAPGRAPKLATLESSLGTTDTVVLFTDGLSTHIDIEEERDLLREHPIVIAHQLVKRFARANDDVLVLVAR